MIICISFLKRIRGTSFQYLYLRTLKHMIRLWWCWSRSPENFLRFLVQFLYLEHSSIRSTYNYVDLVPRKTKVPRFSTLSRTPKDTIHVQLCWSRSSKNFRCTLFLVPIFRTLKHTVCLRQCGSCSSKRSEVPRFSTYLYLNTKAFDLLTLNLFLSHVPQWYSS